MSLAYYPMYPTDFDADTGHLSMAEDGCYNRLLRLSWRCPECKMPDDLDWICRKARAVTEADRALVQAVLAEFFKRAKGKVWSARLHAEYVKANDAHKIGIERARKGGNAKALKDKALKPASSIPQACLEHANQNQNQKEEKEAAAANARTEILPVSQPEEPTDWERILTAIGVDPVSGMHGPNGRMIGTQADMAEVARWLALPGLTVPIVCEEIRRIMARRQGAPPKSFRFFNDAMAELSGRLSAPPLDPIAPTTTAPKGSNHDRRAFDQSIRAVAAGLDDGTIRLDSASRDPLAQLARLNADPNQHRAVAVLRPGQRSGAAGGDP